MRKGSALLIVLGLLSFMVVSSVGFAMFMRQSRVPSSYLRRTASARYLLKAALANAISRLDGQLATELQIDNPSVFGNRPDKVNGYCEGVYDDPYPGVGESAALDTDPNHSRNGDWWCRRVFCPFGFVWPTEDENNPGVKKFETVSTLTLEGLAYLPPAIINEVRLYSRLTRTAMWRPLAYDAGRYAFCAVDVSDCFDINKVAAGERRTSASGERVNLSSLFPDNGGALDDILKKCSNYWTPGGGNIPFTSVADFNIVAGNDPFSPFYRCIGKEDGINNMIRNSPQTVSNALFITDTWFPPTNTVSSARRCNLAAGGVLNQPFTTFNAMNLLDLAKESNQSSFRWLMMRNLGGVGLACLYDYLDMNDRPISFSIPSTETVPMVCGVGLAHNGRFTPTVTEGTEVFGKEKDTPYFDEHQSTEQNCQYRWGAKRYSLTKLMSAEMMLTGLAAYPFKRTGAKGYSTNFKGEALLRVFMGPVDVASRLAANSPLWPSAVADWNTGTAKGLVTVKCPISTGLTMSGDVKTTADAVKFFVGTVPQPTVDVPVFWYVREQMRRKDPDTGAWMEWQDLEGGEYYSLDGIKEDGLKPFTAEGVVDQEWTKAATQADNSAPASGGTTAPKKVANWDSTTPYVPHVLVWVRIMNEKDETVDIVPARLEDDGLWGTGSFNAAGMGAKFGDRTPILEFRGDEDRAFTFGVGIEEKLKGAEPFTKWAQLYAIDPRYNFAPENWFAMAGTGQVDPTEWIHAIGADTQGGLIGTDGRDSDIFMFTSDQEYLQSAGELAFLPWLHPMDGTGDFFENAYLNGCNFSGAGFENRVISEPIKPEDMTSAKFASADFMWRTYTPVDKGDGKDDIYALKDGAVNVEVSSGENDFRVNPFSPDQRVLMAALKDTPFDYYAASTNAVVQTSVGRRELATCTPAERNQFAFCEESAVARFYDEDLMGIAQELRARFDQSARTERFPAWQTVYDALPWFDGQCNDLQKSFLGFEMDDPLHGVDRKYLHAFWRECFQNRQQLFLVFIRAEPLTVGGMGEGSLASAQLGARGVALVWRDPLPPNKGGRENRPRRTDLTRPDAFRDLNTTYAPHRTRVLFYHQFD